MDFSGAMNYENKVNCLESFGVNKTAEYCTKQIKAVNENFKYPLKNKYDCLTNPKNSWPTAQISTDAGLCLDKYYDF